MEDNFARQQSRMQLHKMAASGKLIPSRETCGMSGGGSARKEINMDNKAYQKMDYALCLLSAAADGKRHGCIVNSFHQVTSSFPPKFTVAVNKDHETCKAIQAAGSFSVTLLGADAPGEIIDLFGYKSGRVTDKFAGRAAETDSNGNPYLKEHMVSRIACKVVDQMEIGSFLLFVGQATEAEVLGDGRVLTLQAYTDRGKATPPTATVYRTVEINGYRCTVCGYVYEGESCRRISAALVSRPGGEICEDREIKDKPRAGTVRGLLFG
ncbi:MAG: flavin reductase [Oscillibacter sp.]|nr:flavin reductase [Oscillibacter sp.]